MPTPAANLKDIYTVDLALMVGSDALGHRPYKLSSSFVITADGISLLGPADVTPVDADLPNLYILRLESTGSTLRLVMSLNTDAVVMTVNFRGVVQFVKGGSFTYARPAQQTMTLFLEAGDYTEGTGVWAGKASLGSSGTATLVQDTVGNRFSTTIIPSTLLNGKRAVTSENNDFGYVRTGIVDQLVSQVVSAAAGTITIAFRPNALEAAYAAAQCFMDAPLVLDSNHRFAMTVSAGGVRAYITTSIATMVTPYAITALDTSDWYIAQMRWSQTLGRVECRVNGGPWKVDNSGSGLLDNVTGTFRLAENPSAGFPAPGDQGKNFIGYYAFVGASQVFESNAKCDDIWHYVDGALNRTFAAPLRYPVGL